MSTKPENLWKEINCLKVFLIGWLLFLTKSEIEDLPGVTLFKSYISSIFLKASLVNFLE